MASEINVKNVPSNLFECPICLEILVAPITLSCGHTFCEPCIKSKYFNFIKRVCPLCRRFIPLDVLIDHLLKLQYLDTKDYRQRIEGAKAFTKDCNESRSAVICRWIRTIFPWIIIMMLLYHLLKVKMQFFSSFNFKNYKEKALKIANSIKVENSLDFKFLLFSQFLRFLLSTVIIH